MGRGRLVEGESVLVLFVAALEEVDEEPDASDEGDEGQEVAPAAVAAVVEPAHEHGEAGEEEQELREAAAHVGCHEEARNVAEGVADEAEHEEHGNDSYLREEPEPPEFGTRRAAGEGGVFAEAGANG